jgi:hypothetical protein
LAIGVLASTIVDHQAGGIVEVGAGRRVQVIQLNRGPASPISATGAPLAVKSWWTSFT